MKRIMFAAVLALAATFIGSAFAKDVQVQGYTRKDGSYVQPHVRTAPNSSRMDNYSTQGNVNPYTGREGSVDPYAPRGNAPGSYLNNNSVQQQPQTRPPEPFGNR